MSEGPETGKTGQVTFTLDGGAVIKALLIAAITGFAMIVFDDYIRGIQHEGRIESLERDMERLHSSPD